MQSEKMKKRSQMTNSPSDFDISEAHEGVGEQFNGQDIYNFLKRTV